MQPTTPAAERLFATVELLELIITALPLREMLVARQVSASWRDVIEASATLKAVRSEPMVSVQLDLSPECSLSAETLMLYANVTLLFDRPITFRRVASPLGGKASGFTYIMKRGEAPPKPYPYQTLGGCFGAKALRFNHENAWKYETLLPGTPHRMTWNFGVNKNPWLRDAVSHKNLGLNGTQVGECYTVGVWPNLRLPAFLGTKEALLAKFDRDEAVADCSFARLFGHSLLLFGEDEVCFKVTA